MRSAGSLVDLLGDSNQFIPQCHCCEIFVCAVVIVSRGTPLSHSRQGVPLRAIKVPFIGNLEAHECGFGISLWILSNPDRTCLLVYKSALVGMCRGIVDPLDRDRRANARSSPTI